MTTRNPGSYIGEALANLPRKRKRKRAKPPRCRCAEMRAALRSLVDLYVMNRGCDSEFIGCATPASSWEITPRQRAKSPYWRAFDRARKLLGESLSPKRAVGKKRTGNRGAK